MNPNQNLQIPLFHTTYQYHWVLIRKRGPYWYDTGKSYALRAFLSAQTMRDGFYGWLAVPHTHSRQSEQWNLFRTAPLKACDEPSRPTVRWPLGRTDEFELRCKRGKSTRSTPTASAPPAPFAWRAQARPEGKASRGSRVLSACCIFGTFITCHKFFNVPPSTTADVVCDSARPWATGMKETTVARTHRVCVSAPHKLPLCSSSELKN